MIKDAEAHAEEDKQRRDEADVRNSAESLVYQTEKFISESGDKVPGESKLKVQDAIKGVKDALAGTDLAAVRSAVEKLNAESAELSQAIYQSEQGGDAAGGSGDDDVVDAEVVDDDAEQK